MIRLYKILASITMIGACILMLTAVMEDNYTKAIFWLLSSIVLLQSTRTDFKK